MLLHTVNKSFNGCNRLVHHGLLFSIKLELDDILDTLLTQNGRHADIVTVDAELALQDSSRSGEHASGP